MTTTGTLALFAALSARVLKWNEVQREADQIQDKKQQESKKYKYNKKKVLLLLLFFLLVGAQRGEVEVRYSFSATRRRSRLPWTLGGSCSRIGSGGPRRPRPSCRRGMRCSRGNGTCRGGACPTAPRLLDGLLLTSKGRDEAYAQALAVPVIVKKMQHVSDMATEFAVSALWRLCKNSPAEGGGCKAEALQVGAFQKLLLLLQVGCGGVTKDRASELLKLLNGFRGSVECIETVDFRGLKRPF